MAGRPAGAVFLPSMLEAMCCQAFFNPDIIRILRLILYAHEADYNQVQEEEDWMDAQEKASPLGAEGPAPAGGLHSTSEPEGIASPISKAEAMRSCAIVTQVPPPPLTPARLCSAVLPFPRRACGWLTHWLLPCADPN